MPKTFLKYIGPQEAVIVYDGSRGFEFFNFNRKPESQEQSKKQNVEVELSFAVKVVQGTVGTWQYGSDVTAELAKIADDQKAETDLANEAEALAAEEKEGN